MGPGMRGIQFFYVEVFHYQSCERLVIRVHSLIDGAVKCKTGESFSCLLPPVNMRMYPYFCVLLLVTRRQSVHSWLFCCGLQSLLIIEVSNQLSLLFISCSLCLFMSLGAMSRSGESGGRV